MPGVCVRERDCMGWTWPCRTLGMGEGITFVCWSCMAAVVASVSKLRMYTVESV